MSKKFLIVSKYLGLFILFFIFNYFFNYHLSSDDSFTSYVFSYAIRIGEIPYRDFNLIVPPLYSFVMSLGLIVFNNHLIFVIEHSIFLVFMFYLLKKIFGNKVLLVFSTLFSLGCFCLCATYNFLILFFLIYLIYLEKNKSSYDFLIGFIVGLSILTKHTIGLFFIIPSLIFYYRDYKRLLLRLFGVIVPCILFLFYLILTNSLYYFIDICFFGLFDFNSNNSSFSFLFFLSVFLILIILIFIYKDKKNITNCYILFSSLLVVPLFDIHHFVLFFFCFIMLIAQYINCRRIEILYIIFNFICFALFCWPVFSHKMVRVEKFNHLNYMLFDENFSKRLNLEFDYIDLYDNPIFLSYNNNYYEISHNNLISYYSNFNNGNFGYNGINTIIERVKSEHDRYVIISKIDYTRGKYAYSQFAFGVCDYIMENYKLVDETNEFYVYYID